MSARPAGPPAPGRYRNPVLAADWSDPDAVRVGDDFYLTASSFCRVPGLPLLHSRDLVHWRIVGHALDRLAPAEEFAEPRPERGVWAPALRHHAGRFWIFYGDPDRGVFQVNAADPGGPWTEPRLVKEGRGLIDPCPLWDADGRAYLVHAWARSRSGVRNRLTVHRMSPDGTGVLDEGRTAVDGDALPGWFTLEGPKFYRRDGWYWIFAPAGSVETGWQGALRARHPYGPYEARVVLAQGDTPVNGPHQGAWVTTPDGADWFLHFQHRGAFGRVVHLQPMAWGADGWPVVGDGGEPVAEHALPVPGQPPCRPETDDDFPGGGFGPQWSWLANPQPGWLAPHDGDGLRLACRPTAAAADLRRLPGVLAQRLPVGPCAAEVELSLAGAGPGARAGLAVVGDAYRWLGLERDATGVRLVHRFAEPDGGPERDADHPRPVAGERVRLRVAITDDGRCRFSHAPVADGAGGGNGAGGASGAAGPAEVSAASNASNASDPSGRDPAPVPTGQEFAAHPWGWIGAQLALFAAAPAGQPAAGTAEFTRFRIVVGP